MQKNIKKISAFALFLLFSALLYAEKNLPDGFKKIRFGMTVDQVKEELKKDPSFGFRGDRDVSLLPGENRILIETDTSRTAPYSFLERCWFQFFDDKLYTITINMKKKKMDHYSIYTTLTEKYGNPDSLNPEKSEWRSDGVIMSLERPLTLKYTDRKIFEDLQSKAMVKETAEEQSKQDFLDLL